MVPSLNIFLVEDEKDIRELLQNALEDAGYAVAIASDADQAIQLLEAPDANYRALVTDINLTPGSVTGWDVAKRARELHPEVVVVYMTGHCGDEWASAGVPHSVLVRKPFAPAQVITAVSQLLNVGNTPGS